MLSKQLWILNLALVASASCFQLRADDLGDFKACIGSSGSASTCSLPAGTYSITETLHIERSNITIQGVTDQPDAVVLQRGADILYIMDTLTVPQSNVTIQFLTFDGNRQNAPGNLSCLGSGTYHNYVDLLLRINHSLGTGWYTVQHVNFVNAPGSALELDGNVNDGVHASTVSYSVFSHGVNGAAPLTATRETAIFLEGGPGTGAYYNSIAYAGTAAITTLAQEGGGQGFVIYGNTLAMNRYEQPDGVSGGQIYIGDGTTAATVAANTINGGYWDTTNKPDGANPMICNPPGPQLWAVGIEAFGTNHAFYNNWILANFGWGMLIRNASTILVSTDNPFNPGESRKWIEQNGGCFQTHGCYGGLVAGISVTDSDGPVSNFMFQNLRVQSNSRYGGYLQGVGSGSGNSAWGLSSAGFSGSQCIVNSVSTNWLLTPSSNSIYGSYSTVSPCP